MQTSVRIDGANCPTCFNETVDALARLEGVTRVHGSLAGPCIEVDHDIPLEAIESTVRARLRGVEVFGSEIHMVPLEPLPLHATCSQHRPPLEGSARSSSRDRHVVDPSMTLGGIVTRRPELAAELERRGLDYCCHGSRTLEDAARSAGLDASAVAAELSAVATDNVTHEWTTLAPAELVDHVETVHHRYLWAELARISALVDKIVTVHGANHSELLDVQRLFGQLRDDLEPHLTREEHDVFPLIRRGVDAGVPAAGSRRDLDAQIEALIDEHETVGSLLDAMRALTSGYTVPADGCASYAACYRALAELEADTHLHVHKENNVLFPAVRAAMVA